MKKALIVLSVITSVLLSSCGSTQEVVVKKMDGFHVYATEEFKIQVPDEWETLTSVNFKSDTPQNTIVSFRSNMRDVKFTPNIVIIKNEIPEGTKTSDYAKALQQKLATSLASYGEIFAQKDVILIGGQENETVFVHIEGRDDPSSDLKRFMQKAGIKGKTAYVAVGSCLSTAGEDVFKKLEGALRTFEVK